jgi:hypothetical protein
MLNNLFNTICINCLSPIAVSTSLNLEILSPAKGMKFSITGRGFAPVDSS